MFGSLKAHKVTDDLAYMKTQIANVCFIGKVGDKNTDWVLVDTGIPGSADSIMEAAESLYGRDNPPKAIVLTHGHFDHVGAVQELAKKWNVPVYAHEQELPYLTGKQSYPPPDPSVSDGLMAKLSPLYPRGPINLGHRIAVLPRDGSVPALPEWRWLHTPGHTNGHISLFREKDKVLVAGDAFTTVKQESAAAVLTQKEELHGPPAYYTTDWETAWQSIKKLEALEPSLTITGHGKPMHGHELKKQLEQLARDFGFHEIPEVGRYVHNPIGPDKKQ